MDLMAVKDKRKFQVRCDAGDSGRFEVERTRYLCVLVNGRGSKGRRRCGIPSTSYARSSRMAPSWLRC